VEWVPALREWVSAHGAIGAVLFGAAYVLSALLFVPGAILTLVAGGLFGPRWGLVIVAIATSLADAVAFLIGRHLARDAVARLASRYRRFGVIDAAITQGGWRVVALLRLSPTIPYSASNYLYGLTGIGFWPYWITSGAFTLPGIFAYVYMGYIGMETMERQAKSTVEWALHGVGLVATISATVYVAVIATRQLTSRTTGRHSAGPARPPAERSSRG